MAKPKTIKQIVNDAKSAAQLNIDFEREYGRPPKVDESNELSSFWLKKTKNSSSAATGEASDDSSGGANLMGGIGGFAKKTFSIVDETTKFIGEKMNDIYKSQLGKDDPNSSAEQIAKLLEENGANVINLVKSGTGVVYKAALDQLKQESILLSEVNSKTGISGELSEALRQDMVDASVEAKRYGFELSDVGELFTGLVESSGKFGLINSTTMKDTAPLAAVLGKSMGEMAGIMGEYENIGVGVDQTTKNLSEAATKTISLGMSARKVSETMTASMGKLNEYGFKNGIKGLEDMSRKALEFRMNMDSVFSIADKVFDATSAIDFTANMQVLGGAIGDFNDPLKLMYMATNNVEGLQDALIGAAGSLATYNQEQGRFEVTSVNLRKSKEMADQMGISMGELNKIAIASAERSSAAASLMASGLNMPEKDREFLTNISRMENGEMKIVVPKSLQDQLGMEPIKLDELTQTQKDALIKNQEAFKNMSIRDLADSQLTETQLISRNVDVIATYAKVRGAAFLKGGSSELLSRYAKELNQKLTEKVNVTNPDSAGAKKEGQAAAGKLKEIVNSPEKQKEIIDGLKEKKNEAVQNSTELINKVIDGFKTSFNDSMGSKYDKTRTINLQYNVNDTDPREFTQVKMA
jgi:hypothetical protein